MSFTEAYIYIAILRKEENGFVNRYQNINLIQFFQTKHKKANIYFTINKKNLNQKKI